METNEQQQTSEIIDSFLAGLFRNQPSNDNNIPIEPFLNIEEILHENFISPLEEIINNLPSGLVEPEPVKKVVSEDQFKEFIRGYSTKDCSICLEKNNDCVYLPCGHSFHESCIKPWITDKSSTCPNCKYDCTQIPKVDSDMFD